MVSIWVAGSLTLNSHLLLRCVLDGLFHKEEYSSIQKGMAHNAIPFSQYRRLTLSPAPHVRLPQAQQEQVLPRSLKET